MDWLRDKFDRLEDRFTQEPELPADQTLLDQFNEATTLTRTQRLLGFLVCFGLGMLLSLMAPMFILRPIKLATSLSLGNLLSIGSMMFLYGALAWYSLSYIPYGQAMVMRFLGKTGVSGEF
ncbi:hypothetical protein Ndes2437A_g08946 [Nannochloris sp. 'desiccata']